MDDHGPIEAEHRAMMNAIASTLDEMFNGPKLPGVKRRVGFVVLVAECGNIDGGRVNYISNGNRADMLSMMKEYIARAEGRAPPVPKGKQ